jgi:hypothetical protein
MIARMRAVFLASSLAVPLMGGVPAHGKPTEEKIGTIILDEPLPFTPKELIEPFGWQLRIVENKEKGEINIRSLLGSHLLTFYRDPDNHIRRIYSPLSKNDSDLCDAFSALAKARPVIHAYLQENFKNTIKCNFAEAKP